MRKMTQTIKCKQPRFVLISRTILLRREGRGLCWCRSLLSAYACITWAFPPHCRPHDLSGNPIRASFTHYVILCNLLQSCLAHYYNLYLQSLHLCAVKTQFEQQRYLLLTAVAATVTSVQLILPRYCPAFFSCVCAHFFFCLAMAFLLVS